MEGLAQDPPGHSRFFWLYERTRDGFRRKKHAPSAQFINEVEVSQAGVSTVEFDSESPTPLRDSIIQGIDHLLDAVKLQDVSLVVQPSLIWEYRPLIKCSRSEKEKELLLKYENALPDQPFDELRPGDDAESIITKKSLPQAGVDLLNDCDNAYQPTFRNPHPIRFVSHMEDIADWLVGTVDGTGYQARQPWAPLAAIYQELPQRWQQAQHLLATVTKLHLEGSPADNDDGGEQSRKRSNSQQSHGNTNSATSKNTGTQTASLSNGRNSGSGSGRRDGNKRQRFNGPDPSQPTVDPDLDDDLPCFFVDGEMDKKPGKGCKAMPRPGSKCTERFPTEKAREAHLLEKHNACPYCEYGESNYFATIEYRRNHLLSTHIRPYWIPKGCSNCEQYYKQDSPKRDYRELQSKILNCTSRKPKRCCRMGENSANRTLGSTQIRSNGTGHAPSSKSNSTSQEQRRRKYAEWSPPLRDFTAEVNNAKTTSELLQILFKDGKRVYDIQTPGADLLDYSRYTTTPMATSQQLEPAQPEATAISEPQNAVSGNPMAPTVETPRNTLMGDSGMGMPRNPTSAVISGPSSTLKPSPTPTVEASAACDEITSQGPTTMTNPRQNWSPEQVNHMLDFLNNSEPGGLISFLTEIYKHRPEEYMQVTQRTPVSANGFSEFGPAKVPHPDSGVGSLTNGAAVSDIDMPIDFTCTVPAVRSSPMIPDSSSPVQDSYAIEPGYYTGMLPEDLVNYSLMGLEDGFPPPQY